LDYIFTRSDKTELGARRVVSEDSIKLYLIVFPADCPLARHSFSDGGRTQRIFTLQ